MRFIPIAIISLILLSCEKEDFEAYYTIENKCKLEGVEPLVSDGYEIMYNSQNQVIKKLHFYLLSETEIEYSRKKDSIIYLNGLPVEGYFCYYEFSEWMMKHEKYTFKGNKLQKIDFNVYATSFDNMLMHSGVTTFVYDGANILSSNTVTNTDAVTTSTDCSYVFDGDNLIQIDEVFWSKAIDGGPLDGLIDEYTTYTNKKYSDYNDKLNPYNGLFLLIDFREESLSKNVYNYYEETTLKDGAVTNNTVKSGNFALYNDSGLPESDFSSVFQYDCN